MKSNKMVKRIFIGLLAALIVTTAPVTLASCGNKTETSSYDDSDNAADISDDDSEINDSDNGEENDNESLSDNDDEDTQPASTKKSVVKKKSSK